MTALYYTLAYIGAFMIPIVGFIVLPAVIGLRGPAFCKSKR